jgi:hypothetical protein
MGSLIRHRRRVTAGARTAHLADFRATPWPPFLASTPRFPLAQSYRQGFAELTTRLGDDDYVGVATSAFDESRGQHAQELIPLAEVVQELGEDHFAGHDPLGRQ